MIKKYFLLTCFVFIGIFTGMHSVEARSGYWHLDTSGTCYSAVLDTGVNPFTLGIAGNWRPSRTYVYYSSRKEADVTGPETNIRKDGAFASFLPFFKRNTDSIYKADPDTSVWVWNAQSTLFNIKGFEIENKDPLGRYNAGLYGYDYTMPTAVVQNARFRESLYEGFEDYDFATNGDLLCQAARSFDYSANKQDFDAQNAHSGLRSLRVKKGKPVAAGATVTNSDDENFNFVIKTFQSPCVITDTLLKAIRADAKVVLPSFSPYAGRKMLVSAWVKEENQCNCTTYSQCNVSIKTGTVSMDVLPTGNIIEGWQRIEQVIDIPAGATTFTVTFNATGNTDVFFDDLRIHPYNANMKSFSYNPVNLRLMAQLDENNYATFYEYDDDGTLIRVKKETERGIKTISETRSALIKE
ncbi:hypothetical protein SAMN05660909_01322 [Chitinophaga terrae (ex Kim and Jung 2007)]|uniref:YD repeat-containing protein n=1 Tax=Chitinophaga terrae (ex Kim and Jung 2007) TaxID=408074 RepID=A0A1H3ZWN3_9BACT|nr:hypothetical protein [Chitinophaga terrae (ex Kim and Jung 2007)]MDQ0106171.1 hypothetical protein [Chitinophaga terrae (ex Kim and Jung 2007)]GEP93128.1 hypothetical protein CTE07_47730 [Chitinophaga terrae (ex Kim and Jung 2007)]SEA27704.1 hypothetical protein SAMN05660909_01322 [Chitinophaga terrae (ex Kim and Jung 2007)]